MHVPFCARRCDYCAFATWTDRHHLQSRYLAAVRAEITRAVAAGELAAATTVFVGGGTPSLVDAAGLASVIAAIPVTDDAEVTVECNPDDVTVALVETYLAAGVNRISMGVQSLDPMVLAGLGRTHDPDHVERAIDALSTAGLANVNVDLIYGAAGESVASWDATVRGAIALDTPHVSAYGLTVEAGTPLAAEPDRHPDDDDQAVKYEVADDLLGASGRPWYEISNWARPGHESRHNRLYWAQADYRGIGCAAHSHRQGRRWWNLRTPDRYVEAIEAGQSPEAAGEDLDETTRRTEGLQLAVRTREGIAASDVPDDPVLDGLFAIDGDRAVLTRRGRLLANEVAIRLG